MVILSSFAQFCFVLLLLLFWVLNITLKAGNLKTKVYKIEAYHICFACRNAPVRLLMLRKF